MRDTESVELKRTQKCTKLFKKHSHYKSYKDFCSQSFYTLYIPRAMLSKALKTLRNTKFHQGTLAQALEMQNYALQK